MATTQCAKCGAELGSGRTDEFCPNCSTKDEKAASSTSSFPDTTTIDVSRPVASGRSTLREGQQFGDYKLIRLLGEGGMGVVFEAEHLPSERRVALKVLNHALDSEEARKRFLREGRLAASISHPNSVYIYGTEEIESTPVISMELVGQGTLKDHVKEQGPLPVTEAVDLILQVLAGLEAAEAVGVLHRDIKPANCFVGPDGAVKVGDFGLSVSTLARGESMLTATGAVMGTPSFSSPEQLRGEELDVRSDIYTLGGTLYYLLTGKAPFDAKELVGLISAVLERIPEEPKKLRPEVPGGLSKVVMRCLAKRGSARFATYRQLRSALAPYSSAAPTPATFRLRFVAGVFDFLIAGAPDLALVIWTGADPSQYLGSHRTPQAALIFGIATFWALSYYTVTEGIWGASIGKALCGLRVVDVDRAPPGIARAFFRAFIFAFVAATGPLLIELAFIPAEEYRTIITQDDLTAGFLIAMLLTMAFFSTARRRNGFAAVHDLITGTRVIAAPLSSARPELQLEREPRPETPSLPRIGSYAIVKTLAQREDEELLLGYDEALRRHVWIRRYLVYKPPISALRRDISRAGRLHWLNGKRSQNECWDAYEAVDGKPLASLREPACWSSVRFWLLDVAHEIRAGTAEPPVLKLDRVWITSNNRALLLDFPAPGIEPSVKGSELAAEANSQQFHRADQVSGAVEPQEFLHQLATTALHGPFSVQRPQSEPNYSSTQTPPLPLHAGAFLKSLRETPLRTLDALIEDLRSLGERLATLPWKRRLAVVTCLPLLCGFMLVTITIEERMEQKRWNAHLSERYPGLHMSLLAVAGWEQLTNNTDTNVPHLLKMLDMHIAGHFREIVTNAAFWSEPAVAGMLSESSRRIAERAVSRYPIVSPEEQERADSFVKTYLAHFEAAYRPSNSKYRSMLFVVTNRLLMMSHMLAAAGAIGLIYAAVFRQSFTLQLFGIAVVTKDGHMASRLRLVWRTFLSWSLFFICWTVARPLLGFETI